MKAIIRQFFEHRGLPYVLALAAVVLMLPALWAGLFCDDLIQRMNQFTLAQLPAHSLDTGFVANDSGKLGTVVNHLFAFVHGKEAAARVRDYGIAPWWAPEGWTAALWRPLTAFTHWLDYRLFPNTPALMHSHNIAWFAAAVFLAASLYRKIAATANGRDFQEKLPAPDTRTKMQSALCVAGLAGCLWLLDTNFCFPVMFVANRGFIIALVFGLLCLHCHLRWRTGKSGIWMWLSALCLMLSLLADEGGASTLAFPMAYALVLDSGGWRSRLASLLPAAVVLLVWRMIYVSAGFGVRNLNIYIDPGYSPLFYLKNVLPRTSTLLGGQLTGIPPELPLAMNSTWQTILALLFAGFSFICAVVFWPIVRRNAVARFWAVVMLLAVVPAATVIPLGKNLGFVALGGFGVIASFLVAFAAPPVRAAMPRVLLGVSWCVAVLLLAAHIVGAAAGRVVFARLAPLIPASSTRHCSISRSQDIGDRDVVVINDPILVTLIVPFYRAYCGQTLPRTVRVLAPGSAPFEVSRPDASTLILKANGSDLFECPAVGPFHLGYACKSYNNLLFGGRLWKAGDRVMNKQFVAEILEVSPRGAPRSVAFHFDKPLESAGRVWLFFDWSRQEHAPFALPRPGETIKVAGAGLM
jgi:branched-subunit amino acid transport protein